MKLVDWVVIQTRCLCTDVRVDINFREHSWNTRQSTGKIVSSVFSTCQCKCIFTPSESHDGTGCDRNMNVCEPEYTYKDVVYIKSEHRHSHNRSIHKNTDQHTHIYTYKNAFVHTHTHTPPVTTCPVLESLDRTVWNGTWFQVFWTSFTLCFFLCRVCRRVDAGLETRFCLWFCLWRVWMRTDAGLDPPVVFSVEDL
jgi:hypothetical protein